MPQAEAPPVPKPAATVVVMRETHGAAASALEVFLVQRQRTMGFMGGMYVFPGGKVSPADSGARLLARIADADAPAHRGAWGDDVDDALTLGWAMAAVRETFEESGVLLSSAALSNDVREGLRTRLHQGADFGQLLEEANAELHLSWLQPLSRWITPQSEPVRFDTAFYLAEAPAGQQARHDTMESLAGRWFTPKAALDAERRGDIRLAPPTKITLGTLHETASIEAAMAFAASRRPPVIEPLLKVVGDEVVIVYPGDPEHPVAERALPGPTRRVLRKLDSGG
ncbi:MAG: hypothetical protein OEZ06_19950 [Myxococcales bacterium]|nr:hypothetical protein [Myxococcales bacterium]